MEMDMSADQVFQSANLVAVLGWIILIWGVIFKKPVWRELVAGQVWPTALSAVYTCLIIFFFSKAPGGFDSLVHVQLLFTSPWAALAGWLHYLAFDLFMGAYIARRVMEDGLPQLTLVALLPLTFLFGPIGYLGFQAVRLALRNVRIAA
jgi:Domain of unknown function (DUF4281)